MLISIIVINKITNELDKLQLKREDVFLHEQPISKKLKSMQQNQLNTKNVVGNVIL
jgi:hypothetical protein